MNNPIIQRELIGVLRTRRALALQIVMAAVMALLVMLRFPSSGQADMVGQQAHEVLRVFAYGLLVVVVLIAPAWPATSLVRERQRGTLLLLLGSPMSRLQILFGKLVGSVGFVGLILVLSLPAATACYTMGGIDLVDQLLLLYLMLALMALQLATLGLVVSSHARSTDSAMRLTYGLVLTLVVLAPGPFMFLQGDPIWHVPADWLRCLSPIDAIKHLLRQGAIGAQMVTVDENLALRYVVLNLLITLGFAGMVLRRLDTRIFDQPRRIAAMTQDRSLGVRLWRRLFFLFDPNRRTKLIGGWTNPVMIKEFRTRKFGRAHWLMRMVILCLLISMTLTYAMAQSTMTWGVGIGTVLVVFQMALVLLLTPSLASGLISAERVSGGWQLLQLTPLSTFRIITGKLLSVLFTMCLILASTLPAYGVMIIIEVGAQARVVRVLITLGLTALFAVLLSSAVSSLFKRTAASTAVAYALLLLLCAGTLLVWAGEGTAFTHENVQWILELNPVAAALSLVKARGFESYNLVPANWWVMGVGSGAALLVLMVRTWQLTRPQ